MKANKMELVVQWMIQNMIECQKIASEKGDADSVIALSKEIVKLAKKSRYQTEDIWFEKSDSGANQPPQGRKNNIGDFESCI